MRVAGVLVCLTVTASASAEPEDRDACERVAPRGQLARYDLLGGGAVHAVARTGEHYVIYPHGGAEGGCALYALNAAVSRVEGRLGFGTQAYAMRAPTCGGGECSTIIAFRGKPARAIRVIKTGLDCDEAAELRLIKLFPRRDVVELICRNSGGTETVALYDATADEISPMFQLETGSYAPAAPDEACGRAPVGGLRIEQTGPAPRLRVIDPRDGELVDGKGTLPARQLVYDSVKRQFVASDAPAVATRVDAHRCSARR